MTDTIVVGDQAPWPEGATPQRPAAPAATNGHAKPAPTSDSGHPAHDDTAERAVLGAALLQPSVVPEAAAILRDNDWYRPAHEVIWHAITDRVATGQPVDVITIAAEVGSHRTLAADGGPLYVAGLASDPAVTISNVAWHARIVADKAGDRRDEEIGRWLIQAARNGTPAEQRRQRLEQHTTDRNPAERATIEVPTLDELLAGDDDEPDWIVPGLLERGERAIITAGEGDGKSTLLRQIAIMCAAGIHPFTGLPIDPVNVMVVDLENSVRQTRRQTRAMRVKVGKQLVADRLRFEVRIQGLDLTQAADVTWLSNAVGRYRPQLLITGPVYKMANGDPTEEKSAKPVAMAIDRIRADHDVAVLLEAHSAKAPAGQKRRPMEPYGWSGWMRWPEVGLHLGKDGTLSHWRGQREARDWPALLQRGGPWPWTPVDDPREVQWRQIQQAREASDEPMTLRAIQEATGISKSTVDRLIRDHKYEWTILNGNEPT